MTKFRVIETRQKIEEASKIGQSIGAGLNALTNLASAFGVKTQFISTVKGIYNDFKNIFIAAKNRKYSEDEKKLINALRGGKFNTFIEDIYKKRFKQQEKQQLTVDKPHQDSGLSDHINKNGNTLKEAEFVGDGVVPENNTPVPEMTEEEKNFYSATGLSKEKTTKVLNNLISYFIKDRSYLNPTQMDVTNFIKYFLQYLGDYSKVMSNPKEAEYANSLFMKGDKLEPKEKQWLEDFKKKWEEKNR
jgi:hypothetical protein